MTRMNAAIRQLFALSLFLVGFAGCPPAEGYKVNLMVTVPPEVQAKVSPSFPGFVMARRLVLGKICEPSSIPLTVPYRRWYSGRECDPAFEEIYVVHASDLDVSWFNANGSSALCGDSGAITDQKTIDAVMQRAIGGGWGLQGSGAIAKGDVGSCDDEGNYTGTVIVNLLTPAR